MIYKYYIHNASALYRMSEFGQFQHLYSGNGIWCSVNNGYSAIENIHLFTHTIPYMTEVSKKVVNSVIFRINWL